VLNAVIFARRYGRKNVPALFLTGIILAGGIFLIVKLLIPTFTSGVGYFEYYPMFANALKENLELFIYGKGPTFTTLYGGERLIEELKGNAALGEVDNVGFMVSILEVGVIMAAVFLLFLVSVFRMSREISGHRQPPDPYIKGLKIIIILSMGVTLAHQPLLFDRTIIVFYVLFIALLYSWSRYRMTYHTPALAGTTPARVAPARLG
jgi:hypothetical protein